MRQLMMRYEGGAITVPTPEGIDIRNYVAADYEQMLDALVPLTLQRYGADEIDRVILNHSGVRPEGVFVAEAGGRIVGTATGYTHEPDSEHAGDDGGTLHMVSALPEVSGRGVGLAVCAAAVNYLLEAGRAYVDLTTDDHRLPAIVTYMKLGFRPVIDDDEMRERWQKLETALGDPCVTGEAYYI